VYQHLHSADPLAAGPRALPGLASAFASTQAAWRFFANDAVTLPELAAPLHRAAACALAACPTSYGLVVHDWSVLHYHTHTRKADQALFSQGSDRGYELASALLLDGLDGSPVAPLEIRLRTADAVYSTRPPAPRRTASHLDEVLPTARAIGALGLPRPLVHLLDCEGDSVGHLRRWHRDGHRFVVRSDGTRTARFRERDYRLAEVAQVLEQEGAFGAARPVVYHGRPAEQTVAEAEVVLARPAYYNRRGKRKVVKGKPLRLRLVVSQVRDERGALLAQWCLLTNVPAEVAAAAVALWYYWRWRVESFFKLLKSAGHQLACWGQQTGAAVAKRLLVASMACVVVWRAARLEGEQGESLRALLIRLSGRQLKRGQAYTLPALLAGLGVLLAMVEALKEHDLSEIRQLADQALLRTSDGGASDRKVVGHDSS
jgi:hypothetical protein